MPYYASLEGEITEQELDLTNAHLDDAALAKQELSPGLTWLDLTANRLSSVDPRLLTLPALEHLFLRQNLLTDASELNSMASKTCLEELILHDNHLTAVPELTDFPKLERYEVSYNQIRSLAPLASLDAPALTELYAASNKVPAIEGVSHLTALRTLELGSNRIRAIEGIQPLTQLQELWLGLNRIPTIQGLDSLVNLRKLSIQNNRLESMQGLSALTALEELYLCFNGFTRVEGLQSLTALQVLDLGNNALTAIEGLDGLTCLQDLWLNHNRIESWEAVRSGLLPLKDSLTTVYLEACPIQKSPDYRERLKELLPALEQIDADPVDAPRPRSIAP